jgi:Putative zinc-finger
MKCSEARPLIDLLFDGALDTKDSALVLDHLKTCDECQSEWNSLEQLRGQFLEAKDATQAPDGMMERISRKLKQEETNEQKQFLGRSIRALAVVAIAATVLAIGFLSVPLANELRPQRVPMQTASADKLIEDMLANNNSEAITDRSLLANRIGYDLRYAMLPDWHLGKASVYKSPEKLMMARFDFTRHNKMGDQHLTCYQAQEGQIRANHGKFENVGSKHVFFGNHGNLQFALWSQNHRDYLFFTTLPKEQLEEIVGAA